MITDISVIGNAEMGETAKRRMPVGFLQRLDRLVREHADGSLRRFALGAGISQQTLYSVTNGTVPGADIICKICETYGVSADYLLFGKRARK